MEHSDILEQLEAVIEKLDEASKTTPIIVEGPSDKRALRGLGVSGVIFVLNDGHSIIDTCTRLAADYRMAIIMTDWDRKGGQLARALMDALEANDMHYNIDFRAKVSYLAKKEVKDVEGLPAYIDRLRNDSA